MAEFSRLRNDLMVGFRGEVHAKFSRLPMNYLKERRICTTIVEHCQRVSYHGLVKNSRKELEPTTM